jgi:hypothetical protein
MTVLLVQRVDGMRKSRNSVHRVSSIASESSTREQPSTRKLCKLPALGFSDAETAYPDTRPQCAKSTAYSMMVEKTT